MKVKFIYPWFAPTTMEYRDKRPMSGTLYPRGVHEISADLLPYLPHTAKILNRNDSPEPVEADPNAGLTLRDFDTARAASDAFQEIHNRVHDEVEAEPKQERRGRGRPKGSKNKPKPAE